MRRCLVDLDDTLIGYQVDGQLVNISTGYRICVRNMANYLSGYGFNKVEVEQAHNLVYKNIVTELGFGSTATFPYSFGQTYKFVAQRHGLVVDQGVVEHLEMIGRQVFGFPAVPLPGALEALKELATKFDVIIITKGEPNYQVKKARDAGCLQIASNLVVMSTKSLEEWRQKVIPTFLSETEISQAWMVGDSIKSDINPCLALGLNAIHVKSSDEWDFESMELNTIMDGQRFHVVETFAEALSHLR